MLIKKGQGMEASRKLTVQQSWLQSQKGTNLCHSFLNFISFHAAKREKNTYRRRYHESGRLLWCRARQRTIFPLALQMPRLKRLRWRGFSSYYCLRNRQKVYLCAQNIPVDP
jgi:hypothetical protein